MKSCATGGNRIAVAFLCAVLGLAVSLAPVGCGGQQGGEGTTSIEAVKLQAIQLGPGWTLESSQYFNPLAGSAEQWREMVKLGASNVLNQVFANGGERLQVNYVQFDTAAHAADGLEVIRQAGGTSNSYGTVKNIAVEVIDENAATRQMVLRELSASAEGQATEPEDAGPTVTATFGLACVSGIDYMKANELSNYLQTYTEGQPVDPAMQSVIGTTTFSDNVRMLTGAGRASASYEFDPKPGGSSKDAEVTTYTFDPSRLKHEAGVPYVDVTAKVNPVATDLDTGDGTNLDAGMKAKSLEGTTFFPKDAPEVKSVVDSVTAGLEDDPAKVRALWEWVRDEIAYEGPAGSRYGTLQVLGQRYGRCWDKADVFVTLARSAGIPTREVAGWLSDQGQGHVWAQVYIEGKGWVGVDCTGDEIGNEVNYVPFFATYDGAMPILYTRFPVVE
ncbi:MAG: transglutaminase-like domain-containing protein [Actinomycetota bacterium]